MNALLAIVLALLVATAPWGAQASRATRATRTTRAARAGSKVNQSADELREAIRLTEEGFKRLQEQEQATAKELVTAHDAVVQAGQHRAQAAVAAAQAQQDLGHAHTQVAQATWRSQVAMSAVMTANAALPFNGRLADVPQNRGTWTYYGTLTSHMSALFDHRGTEVLAQRHASYRAGDDKFAKYPYGQGYSGPGEYSDPVKQHLDTLATLYDARVRAGRDAHMAQQALKIANRRVHEVAGPAWWTAHVSFLKADADHSFLSQRERMLFDARMQLGHQLTEHWAALQRLKDQLVRADATEAQPQGRAPSVD